MKDESQRDRLDTLCLPRTFQGPVVPCLFKSPQDCAASMKARVRTGAAPGARQQMKLREMSKSATVAHNKHPRSNGQAAATKGRMQLAVACLRSEHRERSPALKITLPQVAHV